MVAIQPEDEWDRGKQHRDAAQQRRCPARVQCFVHLRREQREAGPEQGSHNGQRRESGRSDEQVRVDDVVEEAEEEESDRTATLGRDVTRLLAWYLMRHNMPPARALQALRQLAVQAHDQSQQEAAIAGQEDLHEQSIKLVLLGAGNQMVQPPGTWTMRSFEDVLRAWQAGTSAAAS